MAGNKNHNDVNISLDKMIQPTLLLLIYNKNSHGYELIQNFNALDPTEVVEPATIYRNLRRMEKEAFVVSKWETLGTGPARRQYEITEKGIAALKEAVVRLKHQKKQIEDFIAIYNDINKRSETNES